MPAVCISDPERDLFIDLSAEAKVFKLAADVPSLSPVAAKVDKEAFKLPETPTKLALEALTSVIALFSSLNLVVASVDPTVSTRTRIFLICWFLAIICSLLK
jgi:hypothetical protein